MVYLKRLMQRHPAELSGLQHCHQIVTVQKFCRSVLCMAHGNITDQRRKPPHKSLTKLSML